MSNAKSDIGRAFDLLGRIFTTDEPLKRVLGLEEAPPPAPAAPVKEEKTEPCAVCGTAPDGDLSLRVITRADKKTIPCPGCLGRK